MGQILSPIFGLFKNHKMKMLTVLLIALAFFILLFPNDDLSDWVQAQVTRSSGIFVQFDDLAFSLIPGPGVEAKNVIVEPVKGLPQLKAGAVEAAASITKLLTAKLGFSVVAHQLFNGDISIDYGQSGKAKSGAPFDEVTIHAEKLKLEDLCDYLRAANMIPVRLQGQLKVDTNVRIDHLFAEQPSMQANLEIPSFTLPGQTIMVDFNGVPVPQQVPTIDIGRVQLKNAKLNEGVLDIPELTLGSSGGEISGKVKGTLGLAFKKNPAGVAPEMNNVDLAMDLTVDKGFLEKNQKTVIGGFLILIPPNLKTDTSKGTRLAFRMKLARPGDVPQFAPLADKLEASATHQNHSSIEIRNPAGRRPRTDSALT